MIYNIINYQDFCVFQLMGKQQKTGSENHPTKRILRKQDKARLYRQFSRQKYRLHKVKFPRMNQGENVGRVIKMWESMTEEEKIDLYEHYLCQKHINEDDNDGKSSENASISSSKRKTIQKNQVKPIFQQTEQKPDTRTGVRVFYRKSQKSKKCSDFSRDQDLPINTRNMDTQRPKSGKMTTRQCQQIRKANLQLRCRQQRRLTFEKPRIFISNFLGEIDLRINGFLPKPQLDVIILGATSDKIIEMNAETRQRQFLLGQTQVQLKFKLHNLANPDLTCMICNANLQGSSLNVIKYNTQQHFLRKHQELFWAYWQLQHWGKPTYYLIDQEGQFKKGYVDHTSARKYMKDWEGKLQLRTRKRNHLSTPLTAAIHKNKTTLFNQRTFECKQLFRCYAQENQCKNHTLLYTQPQSNEDIIQCEITPIRISNDQIRYQLTEKGQFVPVQTDKCNIQYRTKEDGYTWTGARVIPKLFAYMKDTIQDLMDFAPTPCSPKLRTYHSRRFVYAQLIPCRHYQSAMANRYVFPLYEYKDPMQKLQLNEHRNFIGAVNFVLSLELAYNAVQSSFGFLAQFLQIVNAQTERNPHMAHCFQRCSSVAQLFKVFQQSREASDLIINGVQLAKLTTKQDQQRCIHYINEFYHGWTIMNEYCQKLKATTCRIKGGNLHSLQFIYDEKRSGPLENRLSDFYATIKENLEFIDEMTFSQFKRYYPEKIESILANALPVEKIKNVRIDPMQSSQSIIGQIYQPEQ